MRDVLDELLAWWRTGHTVGVGTVVGTWSSAPRQPGASMVVGPDATVVGSVSGGCVEGAVYELADEIRQGAPPVLQRYGVSDDDAYVVGLTCGGIIDIFVERVDQAGFPELESIVEDVHAGRPVAVATIIAGAGEDRIGRRLVVRPDMVAGSLGSQRLDDAVRDDVRGMLLQGRTATVHY
jgi:xanthine dehydrogenase accessory factor